MSTECPILTGIFDGFSWIRCEGKGSFLNSPPMKEFGDARIAAGEKCLVVDLGACSGMDSTFMGTLAGMAARLSAHPDGTLQIADAGSRNRRSLEDLGLDFLMEIDPPVSAWRGNIDAIRTDLKVPAITSSPNSLQRTKLVLEAHQELASKNEKNAEIFSSVVSLLETELKDKLKEAESSGEK
ncbi:MAG: STAS domain-containing protein [Luteolibacter sp.]|uniref:STAS domain-containing protein n=1 Tax=Luteolibacter sp. TaxID=1962973 RepID=UPI003263BEE5